jgi:putative phage-type endonuclease
VSWSISLDQEGPAFHAARAKGIGGSEIAVIMGLSPYRTPHSLWLEKTGRKQPEDIGNLPHVVRGRLSEIACRSIIERDMRLSFKPKMWQREGSICRASDDGWSMEANIILECKAMGKKAHQEAAEGKIPEHYRLQCQYNLAVSGAVKCIFASFRPEDETLHKIDVLPDSEEGAALMARAEEWWRVHVVGDTPPDLVDGDYKDLAGHDELVARYRVLTDRKTEIDRELEVVKQGLESVLGDLPGALVSGAKISRVYRKGNIDYAKVPELKGVNLEPYRRAGSSYVRVNVGTDSDQ